MITAEQLKELDRLYVDVSMATELGWEVNIGGNGYSSHEGLGTLNGVYDILGLTRPEYTTEELREYIISYGEDPADYFDFE